MNPKKKLTNLQSQKLKKVDLDAELSPEDRAKLQRAKQVNTSGIKVDHEWLLLAEFAKVFGWQAYLDAKNDKIQLKEMMTLLAANRKLEAMDTLKHAQTSFIGSVAARTKNPSKTFKSLTKNITKDTKADE